MDRASSRRAFRSLIRLGGLVATAAGLDTVVRGGRSVPGARLANPFVESELRFYAAFYVASGVVALRVAPRADRDTTAVRTLAGALFLAGVGRVIAWRNVGPPHVVQRFLLAIELAAPPAIVAWQTLLSSRTGQASR
jgi:Domain of unknown function (DUF4345)